MAIEGTCNMASPSGSCTRTRAKVPGHRCRRPSALRVALTEAVRCVASTCESIDVILPWTVGCPVTSPTREI